MQPVAKCEDCFRSESKQWKSKQWKEANDADKCIVRYTVRLVELNHDQWKGIEMQENLSGRDHREASLKSIMKRSISTRYQFELSMKGITVIMERYQFD